MNFSRFVLPRQCQYCCVSVAVFVIPGSIHLPTTAQTGKGMEHPTSYRTIKVDGLSIFYREAGPKDAPTILLLHGIPELPRVTSSERNRISFYRSQVVGRTFLIKIHDAASFAF